MKILCSLSGIEFTCDHFPGTFYSKEVAHPIFNLSQHRLLSYAGKWAGSELTATDSYLLFLALLKSTDRVDFRTPVFRTELTNSIVAQNMEHLMKITTKINTIVNPAVVFPKYVISADTRALTNVRYWLDNWYSCYADFQAGKVREWDDRKLVQREHALERLIKNPHKNLKELSGQIADWAAIAGEFPTGMTPNPWSRTGETIPLADYWKSLIVRAASDYGLLGASDQVKVDYAEMMEHCYCEISKGTILSHALFSILRGAMERQKNYLGFEVDTPRFTFVESAEENVEVSNLRVIVGSAPAKEPLQIEYASKFLYLKAKVAWEMAQRMQKAITPTPQIDDDPIPGTEPAIQTSEGNISDDEQIDASSDSEDNDDHISFDSAETL